MHARVRRTIARDWVTLKASLQWQHKEEERKRHTFRYKHTQITELHWPFEFQDGADRQGEIYFLSWVCLCLLLKVREQLFIDKKQCSRKKSPEKSKCPRAATFPAHFSRNNQAPAAISHHVCVTLLNVPNKKQRKAEIKKNPEAKEQVFPHTSNPRHPNSHYSSAK